MRLLEQQKSLLYGGLLTFFLVVGGLFLSNINYLERLDLVVYDALLPFQTKPLSSQVVVVAIDDASLQTLGRWPWSRKRHAQLLDRLTAMGARAVGIDILFPEAQTDDPQADVLLAQALTRNDHTVLVVAPMQQTPLDPITEMLPLPELAAAAKAMGHVDVELDQDGLCRRFFLYAGVGDARWPALALAMLMIGGDAPDTSRLQESVTSSIQSSDGWLRKYRRLIPYAHRGERPKLLSYADVLAGRVPKSAIHDKYVLVGATATGLGDVISTPASRSHERMSGVELNAHILSGLLQGNGIYELPGFYQSIVTSIMILAITVVVIMSPLRMGFISMLAGLVLVVLITVVLVVAWQWWFPPIVPLLMISLSWPLWSLWQLGVESRLRLRLLQRLEHQAQHNIATGLPNHGMLEDRLRAFNNTDSSISGIAALMVVHFNWPGSASIILGRPMGDPLLKTISDRLRAAVKGEKFIAHLNGDDFAILLTGLTNSTAVNLAASDLLKELQKPLVQDSQQLLLAPQIGVSIWPEDGRDGMTLLRNAYTAMFKSRIDDTEHLCLYSADIGQQLKVRSELEQALVYALERGEFEVHYQPQVSARSGRIIGVEALLRWQSPMLGWVGPDAFIPVAEHVGLINTIGNWVLDTACRQLKQWKQEGLGPLRLAVNVSPLQFIIPGLPGNMRSLIEKTGIAPKELELEITESSLMHDIDSAVRVMKQIKQQGMELAIDDFGTGYSSLSSLRHFPLDRLKIDQSFIREIGKDADATEITLTILAMGKQLGLGVIAEGIETVEQAEFLRQHGCDEFQGFLFSKPLCAEDLATLLRSRIDSNLKLL